MEELIFSEEWFIWGKAKDGTVDIANGEQDILHRIPEELARKIIDAHDRSLKRLATELTKRCS